MTTPTLSFGSSLTSTTEMLRPMTLDEVFELVTTDSALKNQTERLRKLATLDRDAARSLKTRLPFVVGSTFRGGIRRLDALEQANYVILDIDHCQDLEGVVPEAVRQDERVALAFVSPSGEGLKLFFRLLEPCTDARQYSAAYRAFASDFAERHRWARGLDLRTSDASRACFLAADASAYHNPSAWPMDWTLYGSPGGGADEVELVEEGGTAAVKASARKPLAERPIDPVAYGAVLKQLNPNAPVRREKQTHIPEELRLVEPVVADLCRMLNWELKAVEPLNYGLKFCVRQGLRLAEINVYWGKRGYSLVRSPKTGTDPALTDALYQHLYGLLFPQPVTENALVLVSPN